MNVPPQLQTRIRAAALRMLIAAVLLLPASLLAEQVPVSIPGETSVISGFLPIYTGQYVLQMTTFGFLWLDTTGLRGGHVQAISVCRVGPPPSNSPYDIAGGDCNALSEIRTFGDKVTAYMWSGQCGGMTRGCGGPRDDGHFYLEFRLGTWEFVGDGDPGMLNSTQTTDPQGRTWTAARAGAGFTNFLWTSSGGSATPTPTPTPTPGTPTPTPTPGTPTPTPTPGGPLTIAVSGPTAGSIGSQLTYTANVSGGTQPYNYFWSCNYNPISPALSPGDQTHVCTYSFPDLYYVKVQVRDSSSPTPITLLGDDYLVTIGGSPSPTPTPVPTPTPTPTPGGSVSVFLSGPSSGEKGAPLTFTASASGGSGSYSYSWWCDFSTFVSPAAGSATQACTYSLAGTYNVKVRVVDTATGANNVSPDHAVTITGGLPAPSSEFTISGPTVTINVFTGRYEASSGSPITFTANEVQGNVAGYTWTFGDGSSSASGRSVTHTYSGAGSYLTNLAVAGNETTRTGTASTTKSIGITGLPLPSTAYDISGATRTSAGYDAEVGNTITFTATGANISSYEWDFGDGTKVLTKSGTHAYSVTGSRTVRLTVTGDGTTTSSGQAVASVAFNVIPAKFKAIIVPGAAHIDLGASVWGTDVTVANTGSDTLTITPYFAPYLDGTPENYDLSQAPYDSRLSFQLAPGASWSQVDVVKYVNGGSNKGTLVFRYEGASDPVVTARVYFASTADPQGPSYGAAFPSYKITGSGGLSTQASEEALAAEQTLIGLRSNSLYRFRLTLYNADSKAGTFRLYAYDQANKQHFIKDATGKSVGYRDFRIGAYQDAHPSDDDLGLNDVSLKYVLKASRAPDTSTGTLIAFGTALDRTSSDIVQVADDTPPTVAESGVIAYYVAGVNHLDTSRAQWRTDLRIFNKSSSARDLGFEYHFTKCAECREQTAEVVSTIPANGLLTFDDVVGSLLKEDTRVDLTGNSAGTLRIFHFEDPDSVSKPLLISSRNYDDRSDGTGTAGTQLGVYSANQSTTAGRPVLVIPGAEDSDRFYSLVGLFALDSVPTKGEIMAFGSDGKEVGSFDFTLNQPGGTGHFGQVYLRALKDWANPGTPVTIRVRVDEGGRVGAYAVTVDLTTNDLTFIQGRPLR